MMWWPNKNAPLGWLRRDGGIYQISKLPKLYAVLGNTFGGNSSQGTFAVPNDMADGLFIRSWTGSGSFGITQKSGAPNISGTSGSLVINTGGSENGALKTVRTGGAGIRATRSAYRVGYITINAKNSNGIYGSADEIRPANRCYLPIIKADDSYFNL